MGSSTNTAKNHQGVSVQMPNLESENVGFTNLDDNEQEATYPSHTRGKKKLRTSKVWDYFDKVDDIAKCRSCHKEMSGKSTSGTSHLKNHVHNSCPVLKSQKDRLLSLTGTPQPSFSQETSRLDFAIATIKHNYPFNMVEHEFFEYFLRGLNPSFNLVCRNTMKNDIMEVHYNQKDKMYSYMESVSRKITVTTDIWSSDHQHLSYMCLTAHFIDDDWHLKKKIINYRKIPYPHDGDSLFRFVSGLLMEWNIDKKLCAIVVDNATANDSMVHRLTEWLVENSGLSLRGGLFHVRCSAHILNLVVQDGLKVIAGTVGKIRDSVRYVNKSPATKQKFDVAVAQLKLTGMKKVPMDVPHRWNSTYLMLDAALGLKEAFTRFEVLDRNYKHNPSIQDWEIAEVIRECLGMFYNATRHFSGSQYSTSNVFFPDICDIRLCLAKWEDSDFECIRAMAIPMKQKYEKYWEECSLLLAIATVLDPRFKMDLVEFYYIKIFGNDSNRHVERVRTSFVELFNEYKPTNDGVDAGNSVRNTLSATLVVDKLSEFDNWRLTRPSLRINEKSELENYLDEPVFPRAENFNILIWWKMNSAKYPILARMAGDILATPVTTVASESAFSIGGRVLDETRSSLLAEVVEALITTADWIESKKMNGNEVSTSQSLSEATQASSFA